MKLKKAKLRRHFVESYFAPEVQFFSGDYPRAGALLKAHHPEMKTAYVLSHTPEQGGDIFLVLINTNILTKIEHQP